MSTVLSRPSLVSLLDGVNSKNDLRRLKKVDISNKNLTSFPRDLEYLENVEWIECYGNKFQELPDDLCNLSTLKCFRGRGNNLKKLPKNMGDLTNLNVLDLRFNNLEKIPGSLYKLKNVKDIDLQDNPLRELPKRVCELFSNDLYKTFRFSSEKMIKSNGFYFPNESFVYFFPTATFHKISELNYDKISEIAYDALFPKNSHLKKETSKISSVVNFQSLLKIKKDRNKKGLRQLGKAGYLELSEKLNKYFFEKQDEFGKPLSLLKFCNEIGLFYKRPENVFDLRFSDTSVKAIPTNITYLDKIQTINIRRNKKLKYLPETLGDLGALWKVKMRDNAFTNFPESLMNNKRVQYIDVSKNKIEKIPEIYEFSTNLKEFNISENLIQYIPKSIKYLKNLKELNLSDNFIGDIPLEICELKYLRRINLENNALYKLTTKVARFFNAHETNVNNNLFFEYAGRWGQRILLNENLSANKSNYDFYGIDYIKHPESVYYQILENINCPVNETEFNYLYKFTKGLSGLIELRNLKNVNEAAYFREINGKKNAPEDKLYAALLNKFAIISNGDFDVLI